MSNNDNVSDGLKNIGAGLAAVAGGAVTGAAGATTGIMTGVGAAATAPVWLGGAAALAGGALVGDGLDRVSGGAISSGIASGIQAAVGNDDVGLKAAGQADDGHYLDAAGTIVSGIADHVGEMIGDQPGIGVPAGVDPSYDPMVAAAAAVPDPSTNQPLNDPSMNQQMNDPSLNQPPTGM